MGFVVDFERALRRIVSVFSNSFRYGAPKTHADKEV